MKSRSSCFKKPYLILICALACFIIVGAIAIASSVAPLVVQPRIFDCDVVIIGAGVGGLTTAKHLAPIYGERLCIFDERNHVGGKVLSHRYTASSDDRPVWTPTHAEQLRGGDAILRCMAQEVGTIMVNRLNTGIHLDFTALGINATAYDCFGTHIPDGPAVCDSPGLPREAILAPNGESGVSPYGPMPDVCGNLSWNECSYIDEFTSLLLSEENAATAGIDETYGEYQRRILGENGGRYYSDNYGLSYQDQLGARYMIEYLNYDNAYSYGVIRAPHAGPHVAMWERVAKFITGNNSRIMLDTRIQSIHRSNNHHNNNNNHHTPSYRMMTTTGDIINAKRIVLAIPPNALESMSGSVVRDLVASPFVTFSDPIHACTWNAFFPTKWWRDHIQACSLSFCATGSRAFVNLSARGREYMQWTYADTDKTPDSISFIQFVATPERQEGNLLRYFFEEERCAEFDGIFAESGELGVRAELMRRTRLKIGPAIDGPIPEPVEAYYSSEPSAYAGIKVGSPLTGQDWLDWGVEPLQGEKICMATEGINMFDSGWMEGAAVAAHNCLKGPVFSDAISAATVNAAETCAAYSTDVPEITELTKTSGGDEACVLMVNEFLLRELGGYPVCGTPDVYPYPTLASFNLTIQPPLYDRILPEVEAARFDSKLKIKVAGLTEKFSTCQGRRC